MIELRKYMTEILSKLLDKFDKLLSLLIEKLKEKSEMKKLYSNLSYEEKSFLKKALETKNFHYECENCNTSGNCDICKNLKIKGIVEVKCGGCYDGDEVNIKPEIINKLKPYLLKNK